MTNSTPIVLATFQTWVFMWSNFGHEPKVKLFWSSWGKFCTFLSLPVSFCPDWDKKARSSSHLVTLRKKGHEIDCGLDHIYLFLSYKDIIYPLLYTWLTKPPYKRNILLFSIARYECITLANRMWADMMFDGLSRCLKCSCVVGFFFLLELPWLVRWTLPM